MLKYLAVFFLLYCAPAFSNSTCVGTTSSGRLENGERLPTSGPNFVSYSYLAVLAGRTYVHSEVKEIIISAYQQLEEQYPEKVFKYAETGFSDGGRFSPHKTHQNGLSVDFMVPVLDENGDSVHLSTTPLNKFGYDIEFSKSGELGGLVIDFEAMAAHIVYLHKEARRLGYDLWRVIFDPEMQAQLFETKYGDYLSKHVQFSTRRSWVRHDEHYHVDFDIPCETGS